MFTGLVTKTARIRAWQGGQGGQRLELTWTPEPAHSPANPPGLDSWTDIRIGESIAVNGVCLTATQLTAHSIFFDVIPETRANSALGEHAAGSLVNLERSLRLGDRLGGHIVFGHVEGIGRLTSRRKEAGQEVFEIEVVQGSDFRVIPKGAVALDGVSLTVVEAAPRRFTVALIPHTLEVTNLGDRRVGDRMNLEMDPIGKWVSQLLANPSYQYYRKDETT